MVLGLLGVPLHREMDEQSLCNVPISLVIHGVLARSEVAECGQKCFCGAMVPIESLN